MQKIAKRFLTRMMIKRGYSSYFASKFPKIIIDDFLQSKNVNFKTKIWAYRRGFLCSKAHIYGINETNFRNHLSDFEYHKLHPLNGTYSKWIDDKLSMKYVLSPFSDYLPKYYFQLEDNEILKLMDCPDGINPTIDGILSLLQKEGNLALKPYSGTRGNGFYRLSYHDGDYFMNTEKADEASVNNLLSVLKGYLVTEYIISHNTIKKIYEQTPNTLRLQFVRNINEKPRIIGSFIRFGTSKSGILETPLAGGILAGIEINNGKIFEPHIISDNKLKCLKYHPDTGEAMEIQLPNWNHAVLKINEILDYIPQLTYVGFDVVITNGGFKILEINSLTSIHGISYYYPYFADEYARKYFTSKFQERPEKFQRILKQLQEMDT
jgi:hypothetical protein